MLLHAREHGQGLVEYAVILLLVALVVVAVLALFGTVVSNLYNDIIAAFP